MLDDVKEITGEDVDIEYVGLNHLSWITSVKKNGEELLPGLIESGFSPKVMANIKDDGFDLECLKAVQGLPSSYLQYYYCREAKLEHQRTDDKTRAEVCMEIEEQLLEMYNDEELCIKPALLDKRGGHKYSLAAVSLINSLANDVNDIQVVNVKNNGTLDFLDDDAIIEAPSVIGADGAKPVKVENFNNQHIIALMRVVKAYEKFTVEAATTGSDEAAIKGLLVHPLVGDWEKATKCYAEMKEAHKDYLPEFEF